MWRKFQDLTIISSTGLWPDDIEPSQKNEWIKQNQHICMRPFDTLSTELSVTPGTSTAELLIRCCCNIIPSDDITFEEVKSDIRKGIKNVRCQKCYTSEEQIGSSERTVGLNSTSPGLINHFLTTGIGGGYEFRIKFSNLCNLACRTCAPEFSSKYAQAHNAIVVQELQNDISENSTAWNTLCAQIKNKCAEDTEVSIAILGGESFIQPGAVKLINWLVDNNLSKQITLRLTTNFTNLNDKIVASFEQFKLISLCASIDSVGINYNYIRWPGKFSTIQENLSVMLSKLSSTLLLSITPVWSLNNIFYIVDYLDWWHNWFTQHNITTVPISNVSMCWPPEMTIQYLPEVYRSNLLSIVTVAYNHKIFNNPAHAAFKEYLNELIIFLSDTETIANNQQVMFNTFLTKTHAHDIVNQIPMKLGNEKFYNILTPDHKTYFENLKVDNS